jgi:hypothetical protein
MSLKIDVSDIIRDHFSTLRSDRRSGVSLVDLLLFVGLPALVAGLMSWLGVTLDAGAVSVLITALAIFTGLLFNLLLLAHGLIRRAADQSNAAAADKQLLKEIYVNISYSILVALSALVGLLIKIVILNHWVVIVLSLVTYFLVGNFLLTLLMVLKRIHVLLRREFA